MKTHLCNSKHVPRSAFTLVELLLVIAIIAILASLGVGVLGQAQNDAAVAATRSRISLIESILEVELEDYEVRRSPVSFSTLSAMVANSPLDSGRALVHVRNLRRMFIADLIRAEMPDGAVTSEMPGAAAIGRNIGDFPTPALRSFFANQLGINLDSVPETSQANRPATVAAWENWAQRYDSTISPDLSNWPPVIDTDGTDGIVEDAALRSELLFEMLQRIDIDGVPASESLGPSAIGDTNGNGVLEVLDGWGDPMFLQWQQVFLTGDPEAGIWEETTGPNGETVCGLSCEHFSPTSGIAIDDYVAPVRPSQIRPFLTSARLFEIDGFPTDATVRSFN